MSDKGESSDGSGGGSPRHTKRAKLAVVATHVGQYAKKQFKRFNNAFFGYLKALQGAGTVNYGLLLFQVCMCLAIVCIAVGAAVQNEVATMQNAGSAYTPNAIDTVQLTAWAWTWGGWALLASTVFGYFLGQWVFSEVLVDANGIPVSRSGA